MFIEQLTEGCELTLTASFGSNTATFTSKVAGIYYPGDKGEISDFLEKHKIRFSKYVVAEMFTFNGRPLSFDNDEIVCNIMGIQDSKPYEWMKVKVYRINLNKYGPAHLIISDSDAQPFNRRNSFRVSVGNDCYIKLRNEDALNKAVLKDLSSVGIGVVIPKYLIVEPGDNILITFSDYLKMFKPKTINRTPESKSEKDIARFKKQISLIEAINGGHPEEKGEKVNQKVEFIVKAIIVRVVDTIQKRTIGCKFLAINEELSKYVNEKQMEKRRMKLK